MSFTQAIRKCVRDWITISGRAPRSEYWWFYLFFALVGSSCVALFFGVASVTGISTFDLLGGWRNWSPNTMVFVGVIGLFGLFLVFLYIAATCAAVRRLHDVGRSGWWVGASLLIELLIGFLEETYGTAPVIGLMNIGSIGIGIAVFIFTLLRSQEGTNKYGPHPFQTTATADIFE